MGATAEGFLIVGGGTLFAIAGVLLVRGRVELEALRANRGVDVPNYDFKTHARLPERRRVEPPRILIVGLAPGMHGANRTGRPFTGDHAGILLYQTLFDFGLASRASSVSRDDGLELRGARIVNAVKCVPPANKPLPA